MIFFVSVNDAWPLVLLKVFVHEEVEEWVRFVCIHLRYFVVLLLLFQKSKKKTFHLSIYHLLTLNIKKNQK